MKVFWTVEHDLVAPDVDRLEFPQVHALSAVVKAKSGPIK
jgi:hypothetical protein